MFQIEGDLTLSSEDLRDLLIKIQENKSKIRTKPKENLSPNAKEYQDPTGRRKASSKIKLPETVTPAIQLQDRNPEQSVPINKRTKGSYYLSFRPNIHNADKIHYDFNFATEGKIDVDPGFGLSFEMGKLMGNWDILCELGYENFKYGNLSWNGQNYDAKGKLSSYHFMIGAGHRLPLSEKISFNSALSLGMANRFDNYEISALSPNTLNEDGLSF